ncbi:MAG: tRNA (adenosine(37)-N6)-threonylcarbamoyltransferase complex dimerization subunit type 1 TsaB [Acidimicrobiia bacterium]|nr:tRNA (adenosine(37)-N6)-threonylcarbamoyltransferase complex dimerization subunit type 1 TsaB [Acidimicrobiia bacterium]
MKLLAIDTATSQIGVAFGDAGRVSGEIRIDGGRRHAEQLVPAIDYLAGELGVGLDQLAGIAVGVGPGLYTGLRVGVTTARTLAQTLGIPMVGVPSLDLVASPWRVTSRNVVAVIDARRTEVFSASYWPVPGGLQREGDYAVGPPEQVAADIVATGNEVLLVGDGVTAYPEAFAGVDHIETIGAAAPSVTALVELATARFEREEFTTPDQVVPMYLRHSDAHIAWDAK